MKMKLLVVVPLLVLSSLSMIAQDERPLNYCGTAAEKSEWLTQFQQNGILQFRNTDEWLLVPVTIHLVGSDTGEGFYSINTLLAAFCTLNTDYAQAKIRFFIKGPINYISNTQYNDHTFTQGREMMIRYSVKNTINSYIVQSAAGNCGYASAPFGIALSKSCMKDKDHTWAHEIGHFLSLPHTFHGWEGQTPNYSLPAPIRVGSVNVERVDGVGCKTSGDGFCDTSPDYLNARWTCNASRQSNQVQIDPQGRTFVSDGTNFMNYANDACMDKFSNEQIAAMRANLKFEKSGYLASTADTTKPASAKLVAITPQDSAIITDYKNVLLSWQAIPKASHYVLEISSQPNFPFILLRYVTSSTSFLTTDLFRNRNYYWRVRPFNAWSECNPPATNGFYFRTLDVTSTNELENFAKINVFPNPVQSGSAIHVHVDTPESMEMDARLLSLSGQLLDSKSWKIVPGSSEFSLQTNQLPAGVYFLRLYSAGAVSTKRIVIGQW